MSLLEPHNLPFAAALCVMAILAVVQMIGLADVLGDHDIDSNQPLSAGPVDGLLSLLGIGRVPFLIWLALFLLVFAGLGLSIQELAENLTGAPLAAWLAAILSGGAALPVTGVIARPLGAMLPRDESTAVTLDELVGRRARISEGVARQGSAARAQVSDRFGHPHHVMLEPHDADGELHAGDDVLLVRREGETFFAAALAPRALSPE